MWNNIKKALALFDLEEPNTLFVAADGSMEYLHFAEVSFPPDEKDAIEEKLKELNVVFVAKYETIAIDRDFLWDNR